jgi:glycosyltransferase involved in cell wall biosynthesis
VCPLFDLSAVCVGWQGEDLSAAYASADAFFTPSETETLGFVVLEAMASGTPVVAARAGGIPDIVEREGETVRHTQQPRGFRSSAERARPPMAGASWRSRLSV